jgi:hypothetical protein
LILYSLSSQLIFLCVTGSGASIWHANDGVSLMIETYCELANAVLAEADPASSDGDGARLRERKCLMIDNVVIGDGCRS